MFTSFFCIGVSAPPDPRKSRPPVSPPYIYIYIYMCRTLETLYTHRGAQAIGRLLQEGSGGAEAPRKKKNTILGGGQAKPRSGSIDLAWERAKRAPLAGILRA